MTTLAHQSLLSKPQGEDRISDRTIAYIGAYTKLELHELVLNAFEQAGITQAVLAKRLGKRPEQVSRLLGGPGNWTIDTFAELLFAIDGSLARVERHWPNMNRRNHSGIGDYTSATSSSSPAKTPPSVTGTYMVEKVR